MSDPQPTVLVAPRKWGYLEDLTEPEGHALEAFRLWTRAQSDPALTARLDALELVHLAASYLLDGETREFADFVEEQPELAHLAALVARYVKKQAAYYLEHGGGRFSPVTEPSGASGAGNAEGREG